VSTELTRLESALRRDRLVVIAGLVAVTLLAWGYLAYLRWRMSPAETMASMASEMALPHARSWGSVELLLLFAMWSVMMVAMMVPSVTPLILMFARARRQRSSSGVVGSAAMLLLGYLTVWTAFSAVAAVTQWVLHRAALMSPMMVSASPVLGGTLLLLAGAFQFSPLKRVCLTHCRSPLHFVLTEVGHGWRGPFVIGLEHGAHCVGCCWNLMALLLVAGVMNLFWVAAIALAVLVEKVAPAGRALGRMAGAALIAAGIVVLAR
jgi:predicted metal-binding membrane protein